MHYAYYIVNVPVHNLLVPLKKSREIESFHKSQLSHGTESSVAGRGMVRVLMELIIFDGF
jgi:hypothetical protein